MVHKNTASTFLLSILLFRLCLQRVFVFSWFHFKQKHRSRQRDIPQYHQSLLRPFQQNRKSRHPAKSIYPLRKRNQQPRLAVSEMNICSADRLFACVTSGNECNAMHTICTFIFLNRLKSSGRHFSRFSLKYQHSLLVSQLCYKKLFFPQYILSQFDHLSNTQSDLGTIHENKLLTSESTGPRSRRSQRR